MKLFVADIWGDDNGHTLDVLLWSQGQQPRLRKWLSTHDPDANVSWWGGSVLITFSSRVVERKFVQTFTMLAHDTLAQLPKHRTVLPHRRMRNCHFDCVRNTGMRLKLRGYHRNAKPEPEAP